MGADQLPLPHLGPQARDLLDRIVASGNAGVERRDTHDWLLSRLIELRYAEDNPVNPSAVVCTAAGRQRWQIEMLADEQRAASAMRRQRIRYRLDERLSNIESRASLPFAIVYPSIMPRLHGGIAPSPPRALKTRLKPTLAILFAAAAAALVVTLGGIEPQDMRTWLAPPHVVAAPDVRPIAAAPVAAPDVPIATAPVAAHTEAAAQTVPLPLPTAQPVAASRIIASAEQVATVLDRTLAKVAAAAPDRSVIADAVRRYDAAVRDVVMTAVDLADAMLSKARQLAGDLVTSAKDSVSPVAAALLQAASATKTPVPAQQVAAQQDVVEQQAPDVPTPVATAPPPKPTPSVIARAMPDERPTSKVPVTRVSDDESQHAVVERLNALSLAAARRGESWRPNGPRNVAQTERPVWR